MTNAAAFTAQDDRHLVAGNPLAARPLRRGELVYLGRVRGQAFAHNPEGLEALRLLDDDEAALLEHADGSTATTLVRRIAGLDDARALALRAALPELLREGYLRSPGAHPAPARPERVFNTWVHLTNACNLACPYCYVAKSNQPMPDEVVERVLGSIATTAASGSVERVHVRFAGGEPMLRFAALRSFVERATELCAPHGGAFTAAVITNGTTVPKEAPAWLATHGISVSVSIDGVGAVQDRMRPHVGGQPSFEALRAGLAAYKAAGLDPFALVTVSDSNVQGLPELTDFLLAQGLGFRFSLVRDLVWGYADLNDHRGAKNAVAPTDNDLLPAATRDRLLAVLNDCYDRVERHIVAQGERGQTIRPSIRRSHRFCDLELYRPMQKACGAGENYVAIGVDGAVSPCQAALHHPGVGHIDPARTLPEQAGAQSQLQPFRRSHGNAECNGCPFRLSCAGGCPLLLHRRDGHIDGRSPYCEIFRAVLPRILQLAALEMSYARRPTSTRPTPASKAETPLAATLA